MIFTDQDYGQLQKLMDESPENRALLQKLLDSQHYTLSKVTHEIRNPLALISSTVQLIESSHPEAASFRHWDSLKEDIEYMTRLLAELSSYNNGDRLNPVRFSSYDFFSRICLSFAASCVNQDMEFTSCLSPFLPEITGDQVKLQEVFLNLLKNALESLSPGGSVRLEAREEKDCIVVRIADSGCGIPAENLEEIFDAFVTHKSGGTGLGLAIVRQTVEAHHGTVSVESAPGRGSCFTVTLPVS